MTQQEKTFWEKLNNLRLQLFRVKLARLECTMKPMPADMLIDALTLRIKLARR